MMTLPFFRQRTILLTFCITCFLVLGSMSVAVAEDRFQVQSDAVFIDTKTGTLWQLERSRKIRSIEQVYEYLNNINEGEHNDWRLPTKKEFDDLFLFYDLRQTGNIDVKPDSAYWHHQENGDISAGSWEIGDECGPARVYYPEKSGYIRAVRP